MPLAAWLINEDGPSRLFPGAVGLEKNLEAWIEQDPRLLDAGLTVVYRQMNIQGVGIVDLLCVDPQGRATVIEIKRGSLTRETIAQALDYASAIAAMPADALRGRIVDKMGPDAVKIPSVAALVDSADGERREVAVIVVGVGRDTSVDRMIDFLGSEFGMPIRAVTFDVLDVDGRQVLVREEPESEAAVSTEKPGSSYSREAVIDRAGGPDSLSGRRMAAIAEAAERNGLFVRPYKRSLMITPPQNRTRFLMNMWTWAGKPSELVLNYSPDAFAEFFPVHGGTVREVLGPPADAVRIETDVDASRWITGLDRLFAVVRGEAATAADEGSDAVPDDP